MARVLLSQSDAAAAAAAATAAAATSAAAAAVAHLSKSDEPGTEGASKAACGGWRWGPWAGGEVHFRFCNAEVSLRSATPHSAAAP
jgi:hypothetical protein